ncbi:hypothetical protein BJ165DRAFT_1532063 [Panaeolus papilionaceus]|nr:hypothetical protein BJ165DRAFT_1532063 [Panaeolus papilionaceus]
MEIDAEHITCSWFNPNAVITPCLILIHYPLPSPPHQPTTSCKPTSRRPTNGEAFMLLSSTAVDMAAAPPLSPFLYGLSKTSTSLNLERSSFVPKARTNSALNGRQPLNMSSSLFSDSLILSSRDPQKQLGPFDGKVAAHIATNPDAHYICTTPNQNYVPHPPYTTIHSLRIRADLRYGNHDHTLFPQPYIGFYSHLGAIPRKPSDPSHRLAIMWWNPTPDSFIASSGGILLGTGSLTPATVAIFQEMEQQIQARVVKYCESTVPTAPKHALDLIAVIATALSNALIRLSSLKTRYTQMRFTVTEFQRYYLELVGLLDYMEIYQPRMRGLQPPASSVDDRVGVFAISEIVAQDFYRAGLPVWYLHPWKGGPFDRNVLQLVSATQSNARMDDHDPPFPTVYTGLLGGREVLDAIHQFSRTWLSSKDPFQSNGIRINPPDSSLSASSPSSSLAPTKGPKPKSTTKPLAGKPKIAGRDKYAPLESNLAPYSIPAWAEGLAAVDTSFSNLVEQTKTSSHFGHYAFPDPAHLVTPASDGKKALLLTTWLLCREAWLACVATRDNLALPTQGWRDILFMDFTATPSLTATKAGARRAEALQMFKPETLEAFRNDPQYATGQSLSWNGASYTPGHLPPPNIVREITWELYLLNFMYELQALDRRACIDLDLGDLNAVYKREVIIMRCFPFLTYKQPTQPMPTTNQGLASNDPSERLTYTLQLCKLMSSWSGEKPDIFKLHERKSPDSISRQHAAELERAVARFYCQTFYNYFGRAAQIPHRLFFVQ